MTFSFQPTKFISSFLKTVFFVGAVFLLIFVSVCDLTDYIYILKIKKIFFYNKIVQEIYYIQKHLNKKNVFGAF